MSDITDISRSTDELPAQPILLIYFNKDKRSFRSQWFSQFSSLESQQVHEIIVTLTQHNARKYILTKCIINST